MRLRLHLRIYHLLRGMVCMSESTIFEPLLLAPMHIVITICVQTHIRALPAHVRFDVMNHLSHGSQNVSFLFIVV